MLASKTTREVASRSPTRTAAPINTTFVTTPSSLSRQRSTKSLKGSSSMPSLPPATTPSVVINPTSVTPTRNAYQRSGSAIGSTSDRVALTRSPYYNANSNVPRSPMNASSNARALSHTKSSHNLLRHQGNGRSYSPSAGRSPSHRAQQAQQYQQQQQRERDRDALLAAANGGASRAELDDAYRRLMATTSTAEWEADLQRQVLATRRPGDLDEIIEKFNTIEQPRDRSGLYSIPTLTTPSSTGGLNSNGSVPWTSLESALSRSLSMAPISSSSTTTSGTTTGNALSLTTSSPLIISSGTSPMSGSSQPGLGPRRSSREPIALSPLDTHGPAADYAARLIAQQNMDRTAAVLASTPTAPPIATLNPLTTSTTTSTASSTTLGNDGVSPTLARAHTYQPLVVSPYSSSAAIPNLYSPVLTTNTNLFSPTSTSNSMAPTPSAAALTATSTPHAQLTYSGPPIKPKSPGAMNNSGAVGANGEPTASLADSLAKLSFTNGNGGVPMEWLEDSDPAWTQELKQLAVTWSFGDVSHHGGIGTGSVSPPSSSSAAMLSWKDERGEGKDWATKYEISDYLKSALGDAHLAYFPPQPTNEVNPTPLTPPTIAVTPTSPSTSTTDSNNTNNNGTAVVLPSASTSTTHGYSPLPLVMYRSSYEPEHATRYWQLAELSDVVKNRLVDDLVHVDDSKGQKLAPYTSLHPDISQLQPAPCTFDFAVPSLTLYSLEADGDWSSLVADQRPPPTPCSRSSALLSSYREPELVPSDHDARGVLKALLLPRTSTVVLKLDGTEKTITEPAARGTIPTNTGAAASTAVSTSLTTTGNSAVVPRSTSSLAVSSSPFSPGGLTSSGTTAAASMTASPFARSPSHSGMVAMTPGGTILPPPIITTSTMDPVASLVQMLQNPATATPSHAAAAIAAITAAGANNSNNATTPGGTGGIPVMLPNGVDLSSNPTAALLMQALSLANSGATSPANSNDALVRTLATALLAQTVANSSNNNNNNNKQQRDNSRGRSRRRSRDRTDRDRSRRGSRSDHDSRSPPRSRSRTPDHDDRDDDRRSDRRTNSNSNAPRSDRGSYRGGNGGNDSRRDSRRASSRDYDRDRDNRSRSRDDRSVVDSRRDDDRASSYRGGGGNGGGDRSDRGGSASDRKKPRASTTYGSALSNLRERSLDERGRTELDVVSARSSARGPPDSERRTLHGEKSGGTNPSSGNGIGNGNASERKDEIKRAPPKRQPPGRPKLAGVREGRDDIRNSDDEEDDPLTPNQKKDLFTKCRNNRYEYHTPYHLLHHIVSFCFCHYVHGCW
jgi:hypothetical protein